MAQLRKEAMQKIIAERSKALDKKLMDKARQEYHDKHGTWPEDDGVTININR